MNIRNILLLSMIISNHILSQTYTGAASNLFFGRQPSAKTEAMGRIVSLNFDPYFVSQSNPAALNFTKGEAVFYSHSSPLYFIKTANYYFGGVLFSLENVGKFAFNVQWLDYGSFVKPYESTSKPNGSFRMTSKIFTLTYANDLKNWFNFGINAHLLTENFGWDENPSGIFFEIGVLRKFNLLQNSRFKDNLLFGLQVNNIFNQSITYNTTIDGNFKHSEISYFPSIFRLGISNELEFSDKNLYKYSHLVKFTFGFEYQDLLNSKYRTAYKFGSELSLLDILYFRLGYYYRTEYDFNIEDNYGYLQDFTYGFGLNINLDNYLSKNFPLSIKIDYVNLPQPSYNKYLDNWDNFKTYNIIIFYAFH